MKKIVVNNDKAFEIDFAGKTYFLRDPSKAEVVKVGEALGNAEPKDADQIFKEFVVSLGLPNDVYDKIGVIGLRHLADELLGGLSGKK